MNQTDRITIMRSAEEALERAAPHLSVSWSGIAETSWYCHIAFFKNLSTDEKCCLFTEVGRRLKKGSPAEAIEITTILLQQIRQVGWKALNGMMRLPDYEGEPQEDSWEPVVPPANTTFIWWCVICRRERPTMRKDGTTTCPKCGTWLIRRAKEEANAVR